MGGCISTSTRDLTIGALQYLCSRSKMVTVSADIPQLSGHHHHLTSTRKMILLSSLTSTDTDPSQLIRERMQSHAGNHGDPNSDIG